MRRLGFYDVQDRIGEGGMGVVYRARDRRTDREVALKLLHAEFEADEERRARFLREGAYAKTVAHPGVVDILEVGEVHIEAGRRTLFLAMELVRGRELASIIARTTPGQRWVAEVGLEITRALVALDHAGLVHRDIKPGNILVDSDGAVKLLDFGLASRRDDPDLDATVAAQSDDLRDDLSRLSGANLTQFGAVVGTPGYAAPEQLRGETVDHRADLYALGATLYQMLTGALPFSGDSPREVLAAIERASSSESSRGSQSAASSVIVDRLVKAVPGVSVRLAQLVGALMSEPIKARPEKAEHVEAALRSILKDDPDLDRALDVSDHERSRSTSAWMRLKDWLDS